MKKTKYRLEQNSITGEFRIMINDGWGWTEFVAAYPQEYRHGKKLTKEEAEEILEKWRRREDEKIAKEKAWKVIK